MHKRESPRYFFRKTLILELLILRFDYLSLIHHTLQFYIYTIIINKVKEFHQQKNLFIFFFKKNPTNTSTARTKWNQSFPHLLDVDAYICVSYSDIVWATIIIGPKYGQGFQGAPIRINYYQTIYSCIWLIGPIVYSGSSWQIA